MQVVLSRNCDGKQNPGSINLCVDSLQNIIEEYNYQIIQRKRVFFFFFKSLSCKASFVNHMYKCQATTHANVTRQEWGTELAATDPFLCYLYFTNACVLEIISNMIVSKMSSFRKVTWFNHSQTQNVTDKCSVSTTTKKPGVIILTIFKQELKRWILLKLSNIYESVISTKTVSLKVQQIIFKVFFQSSQM